jgi:hypothetical protein
MSTTRRERLSSFRLGASVTGLERLEDEVIESESPTMLGASVTQPSDQSEPGRMDGLESATEA